MPGTRLVTVGGTVAGDMHGKNHHKDGGFGAHVEWIALATPRARRASRERNAELFLATLGGMGLTGPILEATLILGGSTAAGFARTVRGRPVAAMAALRARELDLLGRLDRRPRPGGGSGARCCFGANPRAAS